MQHGSLVEFLFDDSRTSEPQPSIVHLHQMLDTFQSGGHVPSLNLRRCLAGGSRVPIIHRLPTGKEHLILEKSVTM